MSSTQDASSESFAPIHTGFMDEHMLALWNMMTAMPADLRLYGGTALALYLDHRASTDFDFATPLPEVDLTLTKKIPWLADASISGGGGMVDATLGLGRPIRVTLMETGHMVPDPARPPLVASNGVHIAHPHDLICAKVEACLNRDSPRDFVDIAHAARRWPDLMKTAIAEHIERSRRPRENIAREFADPPPITTAELTPNDRETLTTLATSLVITATQYAPTKHRNTGHER